MRSTTSFKLFAGSFSLPTRRLNLHSSMPKVFSGKRSLSLIVTARWRYPTVRAHKQLALNRTIQTTTILRQDPSSSPSDLDPAKQTSAPADISTEEYQELADSFMDELVTKVESLQEKKDDVDVDYSVIFTLTPAMNTVARRADNKALHI